MNEENFQLYERMTNEIWTEFWPLLKDAAKELEFQEFKMVDADIPTAECLTKSDNKFYIMYGLNDELKIVNYIRFLGIIRELRSEAEAFELLKSNRAVGPNIFIDNTLMGDKFSSYWTIVLKLDHPTIAGFPDRNWFTYIMGLFDGKLNYYKNSLS